MEVGGFDELEATEAGLREGVFFSDAARRRRPAAVRRRPPRRGAATWPASTTPTAAHTEHVARLALDIWDALAAAPAPTPATPPSASCCGPRRCCTTSAWRSTTTTTTSTRATWCSTPACPGFSPREAALIGQIVRYHRKGKPALGEFAALARRGDEALLARCAAVLRVAEQLERSRDQTVRGVDVAVDGDVLLRLHSGEDTSVARWAAQRQAEVFRRAFGRELVVSD